MTKSETPEETREPDDSQQESSRFDGARPDKPIPEFVRRLLEAGLEKWGERPGELRQRLSELKLPREAWVTLLSQLDDGKSGLYRLVAKEVKDLLQNTNFADDLVRALTKLSFEIKTEVRFIPNDAGISKPKVKSRVNLKVDPTDPSSSSSEDSK